MFTYTFVTCEEVMSIPNRAVGISSPHWEPKIIVMLPIGTWWPAVSKNQPIELEKVDCLPSSYKLCVHRTGSKVFVGGAKV